MCGQLNLAAGPVFSKQVTIDDNGQALRLSTYKELHQEIKELLGRFSSKDYKILIEFVPIPGGSFQIGSPETEIGRDKRDELGRTVELKAYEIMATEFTQGMWEDLREKYPDQLIRNPSVFSTRRNCPSTFKKSFDGAGYCPNHPVENVSFFDIKIVSALLSAHDSEFNYRLPTEEEWEKAARGGTNTAYIYGNDPKELGAHSICGRTPAGRYYRQTSPFGQRKANAYGVKDMSGNVWEWVLDKYSNDYSERVSQEEAMNVQNSEVGEAYRVDRGGGWYWAASDCRSASRGAVFPGGRDRGLGFRLVRVPNKSSK